MRSVRTLVPSLVLLVICGRSYAVTYVVPPDEVLVGKADAIVIARALNSYVEESKERGIETVTVFAIEERLKGPAAIESGFRVRVPGGIIEERGKAARFKIVPGAPSFADGEKVLLFLTREDSNYFVTDFGLGLFGFATDDLGNRVLIRAVTETKGWNLDGTPHREPRRKADEFLQFIRDVSAGQPLRRNYTTEARPLVTGSGSIEQTTSGKLRVATNDCNGCTVTQYTLPGGGETAKGFRWKEFPVSWNRGNAMPNATNDGQDAINLAFTQWTTGSSVAYVSATTNPNLNGIDQSGDSVNNIVFEDDLDGVGDFSCSSGGVLGRAGLQSAVSDATNTVNGEEFFRSVEGDVSMNKGLAACLPTSTFFVDAFHSGLTHEVGHTLGFRHADKSRDNTQDCTNFSTYDCATSAIMTAVVTGGLNGVLAVWDQRAVAALYPATALAAPAGVVATASGATSVTISWTAVSGATSYEVHRSATDDFTVFSGTPVCVATAPTVTCNDTSASANQAYLYKVRAGSTGTFSAADLATTVVFTDPTLTVGSTLVKAAHFTELRTAAAALRTLANLSGFTFTDSTLNSSVVVKRIHLVDLRNAIDAARTAMGFAAGSYTDGTVTAGSTLIKAVHINDLRNVVR